MTLALLVWQAAAMAVKSEVLLASPAKVALRLMGIWREAGFLKSVAFSFSRIAAGFLLGFFGGIMLAFLSFKSEAAGFLIAPYMALIKTVPVVCFIVIFLIRFSSRAISVFISFLIVLPTIYANFLSGLLSADKKLLEVAAVYEMSAFNRLKYIYLPQTEQHLIPAVGVALGLAFKSGVAAEVMGIPSGSIGEQIYQAKIYLNSCDLLTWTAIIILMSFIFDKVFVKLLKEAYSGMKRGAK